MANLLLENALITVAAGGGTNGRKPGSEIEQFAEALAPLVDALAASKYDSLLLRRTTVLVNLGGQSSEPINDVQASVLLRRKGALVVKGTGLLRGQRVSFDVSMPTASAEQKVAADGRVPLKLTLKAPLIEAQFDGRFSAEAGFDLQGQGELSIQRVRQLARWFGAFWGSGPGLRDVSARGQISFSKQTLAFDQASIKIDGNDATGAVALAFSGTRPQLTGTLAFKSFDAGKYLFSQPGEPADPLSWSTIAASALTVPLGMNLDADIRVSAGRGQLGSFNFEQAAATVVLKDGRLLADIAEFGYAGGQGSGQIGADFTSHLPKLSLRGRLERVDLGLLSTALAGYALAQAPASIVADLTAVGATPPEMLGSLAGKLAIKSQDGGRLGIDLRQLAASVLNNDTVGWGAATRGRTAFEQLDLKLIVRDGVLLTDTAETTIGDGTWTATGVLNLAMQRIDVRLIQSRTTPVASKPGALFAKPAVLELRGPWARPLIRSLSEPSNASGAGGPLELPTVAASPNRG